MLSNQFFGLRDLQNKHILQKHNMDLYNNLIVTLFLNIKI